MRTHQATDTITFKCEGCGVRLPATAQLRNNMHYSVCSVACLVAAIRTFWRQHSDPRLRALTEQ